MNRAILYTAMSAGLSLAAFAQAPPDYQPSYQPQPASPQLSAQDLSNLAAPIALYPDLLLSEVLAASTYPLELTQAEQWLQNNPGLRGPQLVDAAKQQNWDPSIQALVAFPDVMSLLTRDIQWTTDLGNAFLSQQADLMDAIQQLRASARANGRLADTPQQRVTYEQQNGQNAIVIQPTDPQVVYPPVYNPAYVWGPPVYGVYPSLGYPAGYGIYYGVATFLGALFTGQLSFGGWGWGLSWLTHGLFLNGLFFSHFGFHGYSGYGFHGGPGYAAHAAWVHDPGHRLGVPYGNRYAGGRYGGGYANSAGRFSGAGRSGYVGSGYRDSGYQGGSRQMQAYRGLTEGSARSGGYRSYGGYGTDRSASSYGGSRNYAGVASNSYGRGYANGGGSPGRDFSNASHYSQARSSGGSFSAPHNSKPSGHFGGGGGGHSSGGHSRSSGGGHSHGGSHHK
jgi:hypothetical protein